MGTIYTDWLQFIIRWIHLIAGISWIGNSFYFMWLDSSISPSEQPRDNLEGDLWMVHGGGFYLVEKRKMKPGEMPKVLHWFKWEATFTWISGFFLLAVVYYLGADVYLVNPAMGLKPLESVGVSLALLAGCWFVYDTFWQSPLAKRSVRFATTVSLFLVMALAYALSHFFSGRGAFIHLGAIFGTSMVLNVWVRILPAQRRMIEATEKGIIPDYEEGKRAKWRSTHNSYMTLPVLFTMISNHIPAAYAGPYNWVVLLLLCVVGALIRHMMLSWNKNKSGVGALIPALALLAFIIFFAQWSSNGPRTNAAAAGRVPFDHVLQIVQNRCVACHSMSPTDSIFKTAPNGVMFDNPRTIKAFADRIKYRVLTTKTMPFNNKTGITDEERAILGAWVDQGAKIE